MQVPVRFVKPWQGYAVGDHAQFSQPIARQLFSQGVAERVDASERFNPITKPASAPRATSGTLSTKAKGGGDEE